MRGLAAHLLNIVILGLDDLQKATHTPSLGVLVGLRFLFTWGIAAPYGQTLQAGAQPFDNLRSR